MHVRHLITQRFLFFKKTFFLVGFVLSGYTTVAQTRTALVKGVLVDSATLEPLNGASISLNNINDTGSRFFSVSALSGAFEISNLPFGSYTISISHQGIEELQRSFVVCPQHVVYNMDTIKLSKAYITLKEVVVKEITPIKITGDTISYKA